MSSPVCTIFLTATWMILLCFRMLPLYILLLHYYMKAIILCIQYFLYLFLGKHHLILIVYSISNRLHCKVFPCRQNLWLFLCTKQVSLSASWWFHLLDCHFTYVECASHSHLAMIDILCPLVPCRIFLTFILKTRWIFCTYALLTLLCSCYHLSAFCFLNT